MKIKNIILGIALITGMMTERVGASEIEMQTGVTPGKYETIIFMGDSNLWIGGDDCGSPKSWSKEVVDSLRPRVARSFARSGATWTNTAKTRVCGECYSEVINDDNVIYNQLVRIIDAVASGEIRVPNLILISAGSNDAWFSDRRPGLMDVDVNELYTTPSPHGSTPSASTTLAESIRLVCSNLKLSFPGADIVLITPPYNTKVSRQKIDEVADVISQSSRKLHLPCIHLDDDNIINPDKESLQYEMTTDGAHTSFEGAHNIATRVLQSFLSEQKY